jgi:hypothetical protein
VETTLTNNNRARKSLAEQIDRLDGILDGLAEGLNDAVAGAVREAARAAVQEAVRGVLTELLTNPDLLAHIRPTVTMESAPASTAETLVQAPGLVRTLSSPVRSWGQAGLQRLRRAKSFLGQRIAPVSSLVRWGWQQACQSPLMLLTALATGMAAGAAAFYAGPWLSAAVSGLGSCATAVAAQVAFALRRLWCVPQPEA